MMLTFWVLGATTDRRRRPYHHSRRTSSIIRSTTENPTSTSNKITVDATNVWRYLRLDKTSKFVQIRKWKCIGVFTSFLCLDPSLLHTIRTLTRSRTVACWKVACLLQTSACAWWLFGPPVLTRSVWDPTESCPFVGETKPLSLTLLPSLLAFKTNQIFPSRRSSVCECMHRQTGGRYCVKIFHRNSINNNEVNMLLGAFRHTHTLSRSTKYSPMIILHTTRRQEY